MLTENQYDHLLKNVARNLDISEVFYQEAVDKYEDVAEWLGEDESELVKYEPEAYVQGSFRLGTVVRPITDEDQYDIDFVCRLNTSKDSISKEELKSLIGKQIKKRADLADIVEEKGRCWTLNYNDLFHLDVLPSIPDVDDLPTGILLTDKDLFHWQKSNPKSYADWFYSRMSTQVISLKEGLAKSENIEVEDVKDWQVKTDLQRAIQILKRHRDIFVDKTKKNKPASIVLTTLCALTYEPKLTLKETLIYLIKNIDKRIKKEGQKYELKSPISEENFLDKWNEDPKKAVDFFDWIKNINGELLWALENHNYDKLEHLVGESVLRKSKVNEGQALAKSEIFLPSGFEVPDLGSITHAEAPKWSTLPKYTAKVSCKVYSKSKKKFLFNVGSGKYIPKKKALKFEVKTNVPGDYSVEWQVVNTGSEASGNLRGGFYECDEGLKNTRWEESSYKGTHYVEAFIIKDGTCVARSGKFYIKIRNSFF